MQLLLPLAASAPISEHQERTLYLCLRFGSEWQSFTHAFQNAMPYLQFSASTILEQVHNWHRRMRKSVNKERLKDTFGIVECVCITGFFRVFIVQRSFWSY